MELNPEVDKDHESVPALWAMDPKEIDFRPSEEAIAEIRHFLGGSFKNVHPIYICADKKEHVEGAKVQLLKFLSTLNLGRTCAPEVYHSNSTKRTEWVDRVLDIAHKQNDKLILVTSHGRSFVGTLLLGSFANEILQKSDLPMLFLCSRRPKKESRHRVLFATDLTEDSKTAFRDFLDFVKGKTPEVILCHIVRLPLKPSLEKAAKMEKITSIPDYFVEYQKEWANVEIEGFLAELHEKKFNAKIFNLVEESRGSLGRAIGEIAEREGVQLVGVAAHGKPFEKFWLESGVHELLSLQKFNLWVCGPKGVAIHNSITRL